MHYSNFSVPSIGKTVAFSTLFYTLTVNAQYRFEDSLNSKIPGLLKGDTQYFEIVKQALQSKSQNTQAHQYHLYADDFHLQDSTFFEFHLELNLNTSSQNQFRFGFLQDDQKQRYFVLGNSRDQLQYVSPEKDTLLGNQNDYNKSKTVVTVQLFHFPSYTKIRLFHSQSSQPLTFVINTPQQSPTKGFFWQILQNGKGAIGTHRISLLKFGPVPWTNISPSVISTTKISDRELLVVFSENIIAPHAHSIWIHGIPCDSIRMSPLLPNRLTIINPNPFSDTIQVQLKNIQNRYYVSMDTLIQIGSISTPTPQYGDVRFSEFFFDPLPHYGRLKPITYIEIQKRTKTNINLSKCVLKLNQKSHVLPAKILDSQEFILLSPDSGAFPGTTTIQVPLNFLVSKNTLCLYNSENLLLDSIEISSKNYHPLFSDGGVSVETPSRETHPFTPRYLWFSNSDLGGTPGKSNHPLPIGTPQKSHPITALVLDRNTLHIEFNENLKPHQWIYIEDSKRIDSWFFDQNLYHTLMFPTEDSLVKIQYINRKTEPVNALIPVFKKGSPNIEITEILFESVHGNDFIEIYNCGTVSIATEDLDLLQYDENEFIQKVIPLHTARKKWIHPKEHVVITPNDLSILQCYDSVIPHHVLEISVFPNLPSKGGILEVVHHLAGRLDRAPFHRGMHTQTDFHGKSIEKKMYGLLSRYPENWMSHLGLQTLASPTWGKSISYLEPNEKVIRIEHRQIMMHRPQDAIPLHFHFPMDAYYLSAYLFDTWGNPIGYIFNALQMPQKGTLPILWNNLPRISQEGNYIIKFEARHPRSQKVFYQTERITVLNE